MNVEILAGDEAFKLIGDDGFREQWKSLYRRCHWSTVFQSENFVVAWYETYRERFIPLIVVGRDADSSLCGLFPLAIEQSSGNLVIAGVNNAEYHNWLADPDDGDIFVQSALQSLSEKYPGKKLLLLFVLPNVPLDWIKPGRPWANRCSLRPHARGLVTLGDGSSFRETLRKKKQSKINRLKRLGNLHLDRLHSPEELAPVFDELIAYQTLRMRAIYNLAETPQDPLKKRFYLRMMQQPGMLHATALRLDDKLVSAQIHNYNNDQVLLGLITHAPFYAKHSPGELHILMLAAELGKDGVPIFDLTPGGDYKDRYATDYDEAYALEIFFSRSGYLRYRFKRLLVECYKLILKPFGISFDQAKDAIASLVGLRQKWANLKPSSLALEFLRSIKRSLWHKEEFRIYAYDLERAGELSDERRLKVDHVPDLLLYQPVEARQPDINWFFKYALESFGMGNHSYTLVEGERLIQYGWLIEVAEKSPLDGVEKELDLPEGSILIYDFFTHPRERNHGLCRSSLAQMLRDAARTATTNRVYICVSSECAYLRREVESIGFEYQYSYFMKKYFGREARWTSQVKTGDQARATSTQLVSNAIGEPVD
jgi:CelD/BcsL family acetyltransferase involved in cellulose biosynthesis/RimJ/RimL family protein N-acetyltransferase